MFIKFVKRNDLLRYSDDWAQNVAPHVGVETQSVPVEVMLNGKIVVTGWNIQQREEGSC